MTNLTGVSTRSGSQRRTPAGAGTAAFIAMASWRGEFTEEYFAQAAPDPAHFGMPAEDDGARDDPLLSDRSWAISSSRRLDKFVEGCALARAPTQRHTRNVLH